VRARLRFFGCQVRFMLSLQIGRGQRPHGRASIRIAKPGTSGPGGGQVEASVFLGKCAEAGLDRSGPYL